MYKRDFGILLLSALAVYFSLQQEGTFTFRKAWYFSPNKAPAQINSGSTPLPPPIAADLNGDGSTEVLVATHDCKIQLLAPQPHGRQGEGFVAAPLIAEASLLPSKVRVSAGRRPVALATGYLDPEPTELVRALRKQVVVVVTAGWNVMCFDHNLRLLWETSIHENFPHHAEIREAAIHISNQTMLKGDRGVVVVGGGVELGDIASHRAVGGGLDDEDVIEEELTFEENERKHSHSNDGKLSDVEEEVDTSRHFSYYAFEGRSGVQRWAHESKDFHRDVGELKEELIPQHNYRLDAESINTRHYGEVSCRNYRESVVGAMPHQWSRLSDTRLELLHFVKHQHGKGERKHELADGAARKHGGKVSSLSSSRDHAGKDHSNPVASAVGKLAEAAMKGGRPGHHSLHLDPHKGAPNVLVAHMEEGIEAIHLYTGRTICKLHLPKNGLHADLNGDGVLDHVMVYGGNPKASVRSDTGHQHVPNCWTVVNSGVPPRELLFNGTICRQHGLDTGSFTSRSFGREQVLNNLEVAPAALLPILSHKHKSKGYICFLNSRGEVTAYNHGSRVWQIATGASWTPHSMEDITHRVTPTLEPLRLRPGAAPSALLVGGQHMAVVLSEHSHQLASLYYPETPILPLQVMDFNADGLNDLLLVTKSGVYGYAQVRHPGGMAFSALVACLIIAMAVVYFTQTAGGKRSKRSTERAD